MSEFGGPSAFESIDWKGLYGRLLAIWPYGREVTATRFGEKPAIRADVYDLDARKPVSMDALIFPRALVMQLGATVQGKCVVGRLGQGEARGGQKPPWKLSDPTPEDVAAASSYFSANPPRIYTIIGRPSPQPVQPPQPAPTAQLGAPVYQQPPAQPQQPTFPTPPIQDRAPF